ncbi:MAG: transcriptional regulator [Cereibacter sphaeroides]|uniref:Transcriptional regulator n=1 Tax=Cereibacter sphaeroides TaxID=1063 RepID=A0A2W5U812_CERSP|nr:MAG: transcriptional regulator [Cereibacter sphaeroides]
MSHDPYASFCPIAKVSEILEPRWTLLVLGELFAGAHRFNEIHRGLAGMSPTLLSRRLKEMEANGLIQREPDIARGVMSYRPTPRAEELRPVLVALGKWAHRHIDCDVTMEHLDARVLMWNVRRKADVGAMPPARQWVIQFTYPEQPEDARRFWLVVKRAAPVDLCIVDPEQDVDLYIQSNLRTMTSVFLGYTTVAQEVRRGGIELIGDAKLGQAMGSWFVPTMYAAA